VCQDRRRPLPFAPISCTVEKVNGRRINQIGPDGEFGWTLELRGQLSGGKPLEAWIAFESLQAAREKALALGPIADSDTPEC